MDVEDVLASVKIEEYIGQYVELHQQRDEYFGNCPFHSDITPSFSVTPSNGLWWCFGCHEGGNVFTFAQKYHNVEFAEALRKVCEFCGVTEPQMNQRLSAMKVIRKFKHRDRAHKEATYKILEPNVMNRYEKNDSKLDVWRNEGIGNDSLEKFKVRYDPLSNRLVLPIRTPLGAIMNVCGRTLDADYKEKKLRKYTYFYNLGMLDTIYGLWENKEAILQKKEILLFEGAKSVMLCDTWGVHNTGAVLTSHLNPEQRKILMKLGVRVVFALDSDIDVSKDSEIKKLCRFVTVEYISNCDGLLQAKMAPVDAGKEVWNTLYERRKRMN